MNPIVIGGTGGSGTRVPTMILRASGVDMGDEEDLNYALDNLLASYLNHRIINCDVGFTVPEKLLNRSGRWGWKHTSSYFTLPSLHKLYPDMVFIHVVRDGRDIAYAKGISYSAFWQGDMADFGPLPEAMMLQWAISNMQANNYGRLWMEGQYHVVRFEDLCYDAKNTVDKLFSFLDLDRKLVPDLVPLVKRGLPHLGRWKGKPDLQRVQAVGEIALRRFGYL